MKKPKVFEVTIMHRRPAVTDDPKIKFMHTTLVRGPTKKDVKEALVFAFKKEHPDWPILKVYCNQILRKSYPKGKTV